MILAIDDLQGGVVGMAAVDDVGGSRNCLWLAMVKTNDDKILNRNRGNEDTHCS